jgi:hypothetical protein
MHVASRTTGPGDRDAASFLHHFQTRAWPGRFRPIRPRSGGSALAIGVWPSRPWCSSDTRWTWSLRRMESSHSSRPQGLQSGIPDRRPVFLRKADPILLRRLPLGRPA